MPTASSSISDEYVGAFHRADKNQNGVLTRAEIIRALSKDIKLQTMLRLPSRITVSDMESQSSFERVFQSMDISGDRKIDISEFKAFCIRIAQEFLDSKPGVSKLSYDNKRRKELEDIRALEVSRGEKDTEKDMLRGEIAELKQQLKRNKFEQQHDVHNLQTEVKELKASMMTTQKLSLKQEWKNDDVNGGVSMMIRNPRQRHSQHEEVITLNHSINQSINQPINQSINPGYYWD